jgi:hypothetical protein
MYLSEALRHAIAGGWVWSAISKWNGAKTDKKGVRTSTLLRMVLTYDDYSMLNHSRWRWYDNGTISCEVKEVNGTTTVFSTIRIDLYRETNNQVVERRRKRHSYMNAILLRRMRVVEERRKVKASQNDTSPIQIQAGI